MMITRRHSAEDRAGEDAETGTVLLPVDDRTRYCDRTVVAAHGKGRLRRFALGSTTATVEREADSGVLPVRSGAAANGRSSRWRSREV